jgi:hypothetical protein
MKANTELSCAAESDPWNHSSRSSIDRERTLGDCSNDLLDSAPLMAGRFHLHFTCTKKTQRLAKLNDQLTLEEAHHTPLPLSEHCASQSQFLLRAHLLHARHHVVISPPPLG